MFVLINIGLLILTTILFAASFFIIERTKSADYIIGLGINKLLMEMMTGFLYSGLFILFQTIMNGISSKFTVQIFLMGLVILTIILNYRVAIFSLPISLVYFLMNVPISAITYAQVISFSALTIASLIISEVFTEFVGKGVLYGISFSIGLISFLVVGIAFDEGINPTTFSSTLLPMMLIPIIDFSLMYVIKVSLEANLLYESINYNFGNFYRESIKELKISELITKEKILQGIYVTFQIFFDRKSEDKKIKEREIVNSVLDHIQNLVPSDSILFHNGEKHYGLFLPTNFLNKTKYSIDNNNKEKRPEDDPIKILEKYLDVASKKYETINGQIVQVQIFAGVSIYGVQSSSIEQLNENAKFALKINGKHINNRITMFDPALYRVKVEDSYTVRSLDKIIGLDNFVNRFHPIINFETSEVVYQYNHQINLSETEFIDDMKSYMRDLGVHNSFERYYAIDALRKSSNNKKPLIIHYSIELFDADAEFNIEEFLRQLNSMNIDKTKLILLSDFETEKSVNNVSYIKEIMGNLKSEGIKFATDSFEKSDFDFDLYVMKSAEIIKKNSIKTPKNLIVPDISDEDTLFEVLDKGVKFIGGSILQTNINLEKLTKQSKIYIEQLIERRGRHD